MKKKQIKNKLIRDIDIILNNFQNLKEDSYLNKIYEIFKTIDLAVKNGNKIIFCGNGGSAADSQHLAAELVGKFLSVRKPIPAIAITCDTSILTSISNDDSFNNIFARQLDAIGQKGDILYAISTSGKSKNIINALLMGKKKKMKTILVTGKNLKNIKKLNFINQILTVPAKRVDRVQELHISIGHFICELLENQAK